MRHKLVPEPRAQVRPHLPRARREPGALTRTLQRCAARRRARRASVGEMAAALAEAVSVGAGEQLAGSLVGEAGEAVVGVAGESGVAAESDVGAPGGGVAHRGRLLEGDADAAARGVFDGLLVLVVLRGCQLNLAGRLALRRVVHLHM